MDAARGRRAAGTPGDSLSALSFFLAFFLSFFLSTRTALQHDRHCESSSVVTAFVVLLCWARKGGGWTELSGRWRRRHVFLKYPPLVAEPVLDAVREVARPGEARLDLVVKPRVHLLVQLRSSGGARGRGVGARRGGGKSVIRHGQGVLRRSAALHRWSNRGRRGVRNATCACSRRHTMCALLARRVVCTCCQLTCIAFDAS